MLLKRKRSDDELSPFSPGGMSYSYSSPLQSDNGDIAMVDTDTPLSPKTIFSPTFDTRSRSCTPSHLPSRTYKRLRNGRPSEDEVHRKLPDEASSSYSVPFLSWGMFPDSLLRDVRNQQKTPSRCCTRHSTINLSNLSNTSARLPR